MTKKKISEIKTVEEKATRQRYTFSNKTTFNIKEKKKKLIDHLQISRHKLRERKKMRWDKKLYMKQRGKRIPPNHVCQHLTISHRTFITYKTYKLQGRAMLKHTSRHSYTTTHLNTNQMAASIAHPSPLERHTGTKTH